MILQFFLCKLWKNVYKFKKKMPDAKVGALVMCQANVEITFHF